MTERLDEREETFFDARAEYMRLVEAIAEESHVEYGNGNRLAPEDGKVSDAQHGQMDCAKAHHRHPPGATQVRRGIQFAPVDPMTIEESIEERIVPPILSDPSDVPFLLLDDFIWRVIHIDDGEYGDWMRRANVYWFDLFTALAGIDERVEDKLFEIHCVIQYRPSFSIPDTERQVIGLVQELREFFGVREVSESV